MQNACTIVFWLPPAPPSPPPRFIVTIIAKIDHGTVHDACFRVLILLCKHLVHRIYWLGCLVRCLRQMR